MPCCPVRYKVARLAAAYNTLLAALMYQLVTPVSGLCGYMCCWLRLSCQRSESQPCRIELPMAKQNNRGNWAAASCDYNLGVPSLGMKSFSHSPSRLTRTRTYCNRRSRTACPHPHNPRISNAPVCKYRRSYPQTLGYTTSVCVVLPPYSSHEQSNPERGWRTPFLYSHGYIPS
jgi:hypothetical protein